MPVFVHVYVHTWVHACQIICVHMRVRCSLFIWMGIHWAAISKLNAFGEADCFTSLSCCCEWDAALDGYEDWQDSPPTHTHTHTPLYSFSPSFPPSLCPHALLFHLVSLSPHTMYCMSIFFINNFMVFPIFIWFLYFCLVFSLKCIQHPNASKITNLKSVLHLLISSGKRFYTVIFMFFVNDQFIFFSCYICSFTLCHI